MRCAANHRYRFGSQMRAHPNARYLNVLLRIGFVQNSHRPHVNHQSVPPAFAARLLRLTFPCAAVRRREESV